MELLRTVGYDFVARKSSFPEVVLEDPAESAMANARGKALAVAEGLGGVVLGADTVVYLPEEREILGQPVDERDSRRMLDLLRGRVHEVYSGVAVAADGGVEVESVRTRVRIASLTDAEVEAYVATGEGMGKAGGYAIQGRAALFVEGIEGDYTNVVGLPLATTGRMLAARGVRWY